VYYDELHISELVRYCGGVKEFPGTSRYQLAGEIELYLTLEEAEKYRTLCVG
jgi:hypothetical protein